MRSPVLAADLPTFYCALMMIMGDAIDMQNDMSSELIFASTIVITGACVNATIFASVATYVAQLTTASAEHKKKMDWMRGAIASLRLPDSHLETRITQYYEYVWQRHRDFAGRQLIEMLPPGTLRTETAVQANVYMLRKLRIFEDIQENFIASIAFMLKPEVYQPHAFIVLAGQVSHSMHFIKRGTVQVSWPAVEANFSHVIELDDYLNETCLFINRKSNFSARAMTHVDCFRLARQDFEKVMEGYPAGAIHVADVIAQGGVLPLNLANKTVEDIYTAAGIRDVLAMLFNKKWRPGKGFAARLKEFATLNNVGRRGSLIPARTRGPGRRSQVPASTPRGSIIAPDSPKKASAPDSTTASPDLQVEAITPRGGAGGGSDGAYIKMQQQLEQHIEDTQQQLKQHIEESERQLKQHVEAQAEIMFQRLAKLFEGKEPDPSKLLPNLVGSEA